LWLSLNHIEGFLLMQDRLIVGRGRKKSFFGLGAQFEQTTNDLPRAGLLPAPDALRALVKRHRPAADGNDLVKGNFGVWPEHFEVSQEGSIAWYINGTAGNQGDDPIRPGVRLVQREGWGVVGVQGPRARRHIPSGSRAGDESRTFLVRGGGSQKKG